MTYILLFLEHRIVSLHLCFDCFLVGRQVLGVSFQGMKSAQSVGYIIPVPIINHLLRDILKHGRYTGFPNMAINYQFMEHESHRRYLQLNDNQHGILVKSVGPASILSRVLQKDDVITHIDKVPIADNGTIAFRRGERLDFNHLEKSKYVGDIVTFTVIRRSKNCRDFSGIHILDVL